MIKAMQVSETIFKSFGGGFLGFFCFCFQLKAILSTR